MQVCWSEVCAASAAVATRQRAARCSSTEKRGGALGAVRTRIARLLTAPRGAMVISYAGGFRSVKFIVVLSSDPSMQRPDFDIVSYIARWEASPLGRLGAVTPWALTAESAATIRRLLDGLPA